MNEKRILIKVSGESLSSESQPFSMNHFHTLAVQIKELVNDGYQVAIVLGGGNLWRGKDSGDKKFSRTASDYIGMTGTVMNGLILQQSLEKVYNLDSRVMSAIPVAPLCEPYVRRKAIRHLEKGRVVVFTGGIGSPFFSTDTASALRACEINASKIMMAKNGVDRVYDKDPKTHKDAKPYDVLTFDEIIKKDLKIMDQTAIAMCRDNNVKIYVFSANHENCIIKAIKKEIPYTIIQK